MSTLSPRNVQIYGVNVNTEHADWTRVNDLHYLRSDCAKAYLRMQEAAAVEGVHMDCASGFRDFAKQHAIWERKFHQDPRYTALPEAQRVHAILQWSALPGTSRHHWGSDLDIYDHHAVERHALKLEPWEYEQQGPCNALYCWLKANAHNFGFFQPYDRDRGGVAPEPWHWSYAPLANAYLAQFNSSEL